jgi:glycosyltransferase involved in cell wall biosynthesis
VQPSFSLVRKTDKPEIAKNKVFFPLLEKVDENLYLFCPPRALPKPGNLLSAKLTCKWFSLLIGMAARKIGMIDPVLWIYRPQYAVGLNYIRYSKLVFDLTDDLSAYNKKPSIFAFVDSCIKTLARETDQMIVTSPTLFEKYKNFTINCVCIPNGFDSALFNGSRHPPPADMTGIRRPIIGFVGVLFLFLDYDLIHYIVIKHPDKSFVFIGPTERSAEDGVAKIRKLPNTYFLGRKERQTIPKYVSHFDLCINPFKIDDVSRSVSPLKVYEYLACGKPVISTYMEGLAKDGAGKYVSFVKDKKEFSGKIVEILESETEENRNRLKRMKGVSTFSWDNLFEKVDGVFNNFC